MYALNKDGKEDRLVLTFYFLVPPTDFQLHSTYLMKKNAAVAVG